jgi:hypothetical protein
LLLVWSAPAAATHPQHEVEVQRGETLATIAGRTLGDSRLWPALYAANRDRIKDPARVYPGQRLAIPALSDDERKAALDAAAQRAEGERSSRAPGDPGAALQSGAPPERAPRREAAAHPLQDDSAPAPAVD